MGLQTCLEGSQWALSRIEPMQLVIAVRVPEGVQGPPYVLDRADTTYLVTGDLSTDGTAIFVAASGITLDLGGHILT